MAESVCTDQELVEALQRGQGVEELVDRYGNWIHRVARRLLDDPRDAEEVAQGEAAFSSWLYRVATNAAYQRLRARRFLRQQLAYLLAPTR